MREGNRFTGYVSTTGDGWGVIGYPRTWMGDWGDNSEVYIGLAITADGESGGAEAVITDLQIVQLP